MSDNLLEVKMNGVSVQTHYLPMHEEFKKVQIWVAFKNDKNGTILVQPREILENAFLPLRVNWFTRLLFKVWGVKL